MSLDYFDSDRSGQFRRMHRLPRFEGITLFKALSVVSHAKQSI
jgi:hypothetical protein